MIAKGHDIHGVTLVGVVGADMALGFPDFRAAERTFQLLTQVAGRAGRGQTPGRVVLQTYFPDHYAVQYAAAHDFLGFYEKELRFRNWMHYPPYSSLANVLVRSPKLNEALRVVRSSWASGLKRRGMKAFACWAGGGANCPAEAGLSLPLRAEVAQPRKTEHVFCARCSATRRKRKSREHR